MKPICMPFTYLTPPQAEALYSFFGKGVLYSPFSSTPSSWLQELADEGRIEIIASESDDDVLNPTVREYRRWAELHSDKKGGIVNFLIHSSRTAPFFDETSPAQIRSDIKSKMEKGATRKQRDESIDRLFNARLFLALAQDFDEKSDELHQDLNTIQDIEKEIFVDLKGEEEIPLTARGTAGPSDPGAFMTLERVKNWSYLFMRNPVESGIFITFSRSVADHVLDGVPGVRKILMDGDKERIRSWCRAIEYTAEPGGISGILKSLVESPEPLPHFIHPEKGEASADICIRGYPCLTLWLIAGTSPHEFLSRLAEDDTSLSEHGHRAFHNTVLALIQTESC